MIRIAIASVGSLVGQNLLDALDGRRSGIEVVGINSVAAVAGNFRCDRAYLAPPAAQRDAYLRRLAAVLLNERPDLVLPGRDDDVVALAHLKETDPQLRAALPVGPQALARIFDDKWASREFAAAHRLPFVDSAPADDCAAVDRLLAAHGYPLIAKPRHGNGSRGVRLVLDDAHCRAVQQLADTVLQPYLQPEPELVASLRGDGIGVPLFHAPVLQHIVGQAVIGARGEVRGSSCWLAELVMGRAERFVSLDDDDVAQTVRRYAEAAAAAGWVGALNLQGRRDRHGAFLVYELNGRFTGGTMARTLLGFDEVGLLAEGFLGLAIPTPPRTAGRGAIVTKSLADFIIEADAVDRLERDGRWERSPATR